MKLKLIQKKPETSDCITFIFQLEQPLDWQPGQFLQYTLPDPQADDRGEKRFFTNAAAPFEQVVRLTTRFTPEKGSSFKNNLQKLAVGQTIETQSPNGSFVIDDPNKQYIFIAGGIGITPFRAILLDLEHNQKPLNVTLLYANRNNEIVYRDELEGLKNARPNLQIHYIIDPQRIDEQLISQKVPDFKQKVFYLSGPKPLVEAMEKTLADLGVAKEQIKTDYFPGYTS